MERQEIAGAEGIRQKACRLYTNGVFFCAAAFYFIVCMILSPAAYLLYLVLTGTGLKMDRYRNFLGKVWFYSTAAIICRLIGENITVHYDPRILADAKQVVISNHCTYLDWIFLWAMFIQFGKKNIIFVVKKDVMRLWFLRGGMKMLNFIFLERKMDVDGEVINRSANFVKSLKSYLLILFPEGTFIDKATKEKSDRFFETRSKHKKLPLVVKEPTQTVLLPRITGFKAFCGEMEGEIDGIIDCTIAVTPKKGHPADYYTIARIFRGSQKPEVTIICNYHKYSHKQMMEDTWLYKRFMEKDAFLQRYYRESRPAEKDWKKVKEAQQIVRKDVQYRKARIRIPLLYKAFMAAGALGMFFAAASLAAGSLILLARAVRSLVAK